MKTLSFISGVLLALVVSMPSAAAPSGTMRMTYVRGRGITVHAPRTVAETSLPKYIVRTGMGIPTDWPEWIDPPSWVVGQ